jgi:hypothetical protein
MTKDETLLVFTLVVSSVSVFLFGILLFMVLISATRNFRERTKSKLVKIMIWAGIVVITFAIAVRIYPIFIFLLKERIKPLVEALYDKLPWIWEVSLSRYWDRLIDFLDRYLMGVRSKDTNRDSQTKRGIRSHFFLSRKKKALRESNRGWDTSISSEQPLLDS